VTAAADRQAAAARQRRHTEAVVFGPSYHLPPVLSTMGQCASIKGVTCSPGYSTVAGIGSPGPAFFRSFGSRPKMSPGRKPSRATALAKAGFREDLPERRGHVAPRGKPLP
jgi:hypothetical protein